VLPRVGCTPYRGTSLIRKRPTLGPYTRPMPMALWRSEGGGRFLVIGPSRTRPSREGIQGYLARKKARPPYDHCRTLGIVLL